VRVDVAGQDQALAGLHSLRGRHIG
jgi:hypothetical protein